MNRSERISLFALILVVVAAFLISYFYSELFPGKKSEKGTLSDLKIAAWNIEHLAESNGEGCRPRYDEDYIELREYAKNLDADIIALQEVESAKAVARIFPEEDWNTIISQRPPSEPYECYENGNPSTQQKVAIVVRKGIGFEREDDFRELALGMEGLRYGVVIQLTETPVPIDILAVHLKSGCFVEDYSASDSEDCETFEKQAPILDQWVESRLQQNRAFIVLGDFNHRISNQENKFWRELTEMDQRLVFIKNSMENLAGCHPRYPEPIDHILFDQNSEVFYEKNSENVHYFGNNASTMTEEEMLSDHCPVSVEFNFAQEYPRAVLQ
jgi:endonuclease/exonuclease/phosphatase family metal-dependent hydrolase